MKCTQSPKKMDTSEGIQKMEIALAGADIKFSAVYDVLKSADIWIADTGASNHTTFCKSGMTNFVAATNANLGTVGITGDIIQNEGLVDIPGIFCDKYGQEVLKATLTKVGLNRKLNFNLLSLTWMMQDGWIMSGNKEEITVTKDGMKISFDIVIPTNRGAVYAGCFQRNCQVGAAAMARTIPISITQAHTLLGHCDKNVTWRSAAALGWTIEKETMKSCKSCAKSKTRQQNMCKKSTSVKASVPNGRLFSNLLLIKPNSDDENANITNSNWHLMVDEY